MILTIFTCFKAKITFFSFNVPKLQKTLILRGHRLKYIWQIGILLTYQFSLIFVQQAYIKFLVY